MREFASVMVDAFAGEGVHLHKLDFARRQTRAALMRTFVVELEWCTGDGDHVIVARLDGRVVGGVMMSKNTPRLLRTRVVQGLHWLFVAAPLALSVRWRRLPALHRATVLSQPLVGAYYVLPALTVHPEFQGCGIGKRLLDAVHAISERDSSVRGVYLYTGDKKNQEMYERAGYRTIETRHAGELAVCHMFRTNGGFAPSAGNA